MPNAATRRLRASSIAAAMAVMFFAVRADAGQIDLSSLQPEHTYQQFIVRYRQGTPERVDVAKAQAAFANAARSSGLKPIGLKHVRRLSIGADVVGADRKLDGVEAESLMRRIAADPNVEFIQVDRRVNALLTPNDPAYSTQWGYSGPWGIRANKAWDVDRGSGVIVAVIDTGVTDHGDLNANLAFSLPDYGYDFISDPAISNDGDGRDGDPHDPGDWVAANQCGYSHPATNSSWHGTHVAGILAADTNNGLGVAGVANQAKVLPLRVLGTCGGETSDVVDAIVWAAGGSVPGVPTNPYPAEVINMSLGGEGSCSPAEQAAIDFAVGRGTTVVVAAGNSNDDTANYSPASCSNVIAVASTTSSGTRSSFSNYGSLIDVAAPGSSINSTLNMGTTSPGAEGYGYKNGTSMAAPHVAGVAALIQSAAASPKTPSQVEALIRDTATAFPSMPSQPIGTGIVNAERAVNVAIAAPIAINSGTSVPIKKQTATISPIAIPGPGNASNVTRVYVNIAQSAPMAVQLELLAPDGTAYPLPINGAGGGWWPFQLNLSAEPRAGNWTLRVNEVSPVGPVGAQVGTLVSWSIDFQ